MRKASHHIHKPNNAKAICAKCDFASSCRMNGKAEIVLDDVAKATWDRYQEDPQVMVAYCANRRCPRGTEVAGKRLKKALEGGKLIVKKEGRLEIEGVDASLAKRGFVDLDGRLYVYDGHDKDSHIIHSTGQFVDLDKETLALIEKRKKAKQNR